MRLILFLLPLLALACTKNNQNTPAEPNFTPVLTSSTDAIVWQGLDHTWIYNHRWGRLGSGFVYFDPSLELDSYPVHASPLIDYPTTAGWTYMATAGAGTGKDIGAHLAYGTRITPPAGVQFASMTAHKRLAGPEGEIQTWTWTVSSPLPANMENTETVAALLNGFWLERAGSEAKKPFHFAVSIGTPTVASGSLSVDVSVELGLDCDSPECQGCFADPTSPRSDDFLYDFYVDILVAAGPSTDLAVEAFQGPGADEPWDGPPAKESDGACLTEGSNGCFEYFVECGDQRLAQHTELAPDAGTQAAQVAVVAGNSGTIGIRGVELTLDDTHHMMALRASVTDVVWQSGATATFQHGVRFQNWGQDMNLNGQDVDPLSATAFGTDGAYTGNLQLVQLGFSSATQSGVEIDATIITEASQQLLVVP